MLTCLRNKWTHCRSQNLTYACDKQISLTAAYWGLRPAVKESKNLGKECDDGQETLNKGITACISANQNSVDLLKTSTDNLNEFDFNETADTETTTEMQISDDTDEESTMEQNTAEEISEIEKSESEKVSEPEKVTEPEKVAEPEKVSEIEKVADSDQNLENFDPNNFLILTKSQETEIIETQAKLVEKRKSKDQVENVLADSAMWI